MFLPYGLALIIVWLAFAPQTPTQATIQTKEVEYREGGTVFKGFIAWDDATTGKRPGVLVVHEWWGDRKSTRLNSSHLVISYAVFCLKKKKTTSRATTPSAPTSTRRTDSR